MTGNRKLSARPIGLLPTNALVLTGLATFRMVGYPGTVLQAMTKRHFATIYRESVRDWRADREPHAATCKTVAEKGETEDM